MAACDAGLWYLHMWPYGSDALPRQVPGSASDFAKPKIWFRRFQAQPTLLAECLQCLQHLQRIWLICLAIPNQVSPRLEGRGARCCLLVSLFFQKLSSTKLYQAVSSCQILSLFRTFYDRPQLILCQHLCDPQRKTRCQSVVEVDFDRATFRGTVYVRPQSAAGMGNRLWLGPTWTSNSDGKPNWYLDHDGG